MLVKSPEDGDLMFVVFNDGDDDDDDALQRHLPIYRYLYKSGTRSIGRIFGTWSLKLRSTAPNETLYGIQTSVGLSPLHSRSNCVVCAIKTSNGLSLSYYLFLEIRFKPAIPNK